MSYDSFKIMCRNLFCIFWDLADVCLSCCSPNLIAVCDYWFDLCKFTFILVLSLLFLESG